MDQQPVSFDIIIKAPSGNTSDIRLERANLDWTVLYVKELIRTRHPAKPMPKEQKLVHSGRLLEDLKTLRDCLREVSSDSHQVMHLIVSESALQRAQSQPSTPDATGLRRRNIPTSPTSAAAAPANPAPAAAAASVSPAPASPSPSLPSSPSAAAATTAAATTPHDASLFMQAPNSSAAAFSPASFPSSFASPFGSPASFVASPFSPYPAQFVPVSGMNMSMSMNMNMTPEQYEMWMQYCTQYYASLTASGYGSPQAGFAMPGVVNGNLVDDLNNVNNAVQFADNNIINNNNINNNNNNNGRFAQAGLGAAPLFEGAEDRARARARGPHIITGILTLIAKFLLLVTLLGQNTTPIRFYCLCAVSFVILLYQSGLISRRAQPVAAPGAAGAGADGAVNAQVNAQQENAGEIAENEQPQDEGQEGPEQQAAADGENEAEEDEEDQLPRSVFGEIKNIIVAFVSSMVPTGPPPEELAAN